MTPTRYPRRMRAISKITAGAAAALLAIGLLPTTAATAEAPLPEADGLSAITAAASCWEVKQHDPSAPSGIYWLYTPELGQPQQFYCDQTTDGGGWVLIGRGREGWSQSDEGAGTLADVRNTITGQAAFAPRQLSVKVITGLLNGEAVRSLDDGVRLRRAANTAGSLWQEASFTFASPRDEWSWVFNSMQQVATWRIGVSSGTGSQTTNIGNAQNGALRVQTTASARDGWTPGFGYGNNPTIVGNTSATSFIYEQPISTATNSRGEPMTLDPYPRPFTQVYLRPKLLSTEILPQIPDSGTAAMAQPAIASSFALPTVWGVNGLGASGVGIQNTEVSAFAEVNGVVYVGGNFRYVQRTSAGGSRVDQPYLAAFNVNTGELITSFRPTFNDQVKTLVAMSNGRLAVGGEFTTANGAARNGLVVLNAATGQTDAAFTGRLINNLSSSGGRATVRSLDVQGNWLYVGGSFTHATGGSTTAQVYSRSATRLSVSNGTPDSSWRPEFDGTVISLDASGRGDRVYFAGYFENHRGEPVRTAAALTTSGTSLVPWPVMHSDNRTDGVARKYYQQAVREIGDRVWLGGAQHMLFSYDRATMSQLSTNITIQGGDFQAISNDGDAVYAGCHCTIANYSGAQNWPNPVGWSKASRINLTGAWSNTDGSFMPQFSPFFSTREGAGTWALFTDSRGVTWMGGDFTGARRSTTQAQWAGGFARFPRVDSVAPTAPSGLKATAEAGAISLTWTGSTDASGPVTYQVLRNDRVVATTTTTSITLPDAPADTRYFVRAADSSGNLSASTAAAKAGAAPTPGDPENPVLIANGSSWKYWFETAAPAAAWKSVTFDDAAWKSGAAPLGWGHSNLRTTLTAEGTRPLTSYYRGAFTVANVATIDEVQLTTRADDGIVVYVNGVEVGRSNMPAGTVTSTTYATSARSASVATSNPVTFTVPRSLLVTGRNVLSAEVHSNYRSTPSASFELNATATFRDATPLPEEPQEPQEPEEPAGLPAGTVLVQDNADWSYYFEAAAPATAWRDVDFDASAWKSGAAPLGWGSTTIATQVTTTETTKPLATYFRRTFTIPAGSVPQAGLELTTRADDGVIVFVNGVEVGRSNLPAGTVGHNTYALTAPNTANATANPVKITVPASALRDGTNVITAQVQSNYRNTPSKSFALSAVVK